MQDFKNEANIILTIERPLFDASNRSIAALLLQAEIIANTAQNEKDQSSLLTRLLWVTSHNMIVQAEVELASRN
jgi:hypothetical protein